jgi:hypothetical protein
MTRRPASSLMVLAIATCLGGCPSGGEDMNPMMPDVGGPEAGGPGGGAGGEGQAGSGGGQAGGTNGGAQGDSGAGGTADGGTPFTPTPIAALPEAFAQAICDALEACLGDAALRELMAREDCVPRVTAELRASDFHYMDRAIGAGHVLYNPGELPACLDGVRELGCDVLTNSYPEPCVQVLAGNVAEGGECAASMECEGTAFCAGAASGQCPSTCTALLGEGAACAGHHECGDGMLCLQAQCARLAAAGQPCSGPEGGRCRFGLTCLGATDTAAGECVANEQVQAGDENDACEPGGTLCKDGLSCVFDGSNAFHCRPYVGAGAACRLGLPGQCPRDQYCDAMNVTAQGTCRALPGDGAACVLSGLCAPQHVCVAAGSNAVCRPISDNGGPCSADNACRSGRCAGGRCEPPPVCD